MSTIQISIVKKVSEEIYKKNISTKQEKINMDMDWTDFMPYWIKVRGTMDLSYSIVNFGKHKAAATNQNI